MIGTLLRAAGGAASFTLGSLWPMRWPAFPVSFFDFDMFNEPADALWAEAKERCAREARARAAQARELAAQTAIPTTVYPSSSAAGEASANGDRGPTAEAGPALGSLPPEASAGQPTFTAGELEDAAYAVRRHITDRVEPTSVIGAEAWTHLAEKLEAAAVSK